MTRRTLLAMALAGPSPLIDTHIHLFADDRKKFPYHPRGTYQPEPEPLEKYAKFAPAAGIAGAVIVHPEPYQDDHTYLEYCFANEPKKDFFRGTCLFDAMRADTPGRIDGLVKKWPGRERALRIHRVTPTAQTAGPIRERPLDAPEMRATWKALAERGVMVQMHFIPMHARAIGKLAGEFKGVRVVLDHLGRNNQGTEEEWKDVLQLARHKNTVMKFSGLEYSPKGLEARVKQVYESFGPQRIIWGGLGMNEAAFAKAQAELNRLFHFAKEGERELIRGKNALKLYGWA